ncbi:PIG-X [Russula earlei]|uniref:PIG-X n=1 Tax=Russula earlei TaxID=71964 RepID=A0ACC0U6T8_9AGAM|nr:PIG-X [Russula earlei]
MDETVVLLSATLAPTKGFHTTSTTRFAIRSPRPRSCTLYLYFTLPAQLFVDPYELAHRRAYYTFERFGGGNLEAPVFAHGAGGPSGLLLDVIVPESVNDDEADEGDGRTLSVEVPLHARYGVPKAKMEGELIDEVVFPPPEAFWACREQERRAGGSQAKRAQVPDALRDAVKLAPAFRDGAEPMFVLVPRAKSVRAQTLRVPVGDAGDVAVVETGTVIAILFAFVYLLRNIARASRGKRADTVARAKKSI